MGNIIGFISLIITILGWAIVAYLADQTYKKQKMLDKRIDALEETLNILSKIADTNSAYLNNKESLEFLSKCRLKIQIFGKRSEIDKMEQYIRSLEKKDVNVIIDSHKALVDELLNNLRKEIHIA